MNWQLPDKVGTKKLNPLPHAVRTNRKQLRSFREVLLVDAVSYCTPGHIKYAAVTSRTNVVRELTTCLAHGVRGDVPT